MTMAGDDARQRIEAYLGRLRRRLRGMNDEAVREIVEELRVHIMDKAAANGEVTSLAVDEALTALGSPEELASQYLTEDLMAQAEVSRSPLRILDSMFHWASLSVNGFLVLMASILGYFTGTIFILCAVLKPFHPHTAGLWVLPDGAISLRMGFGNAPPGGRDLLGWWIVPAGLAAGCGLVMLTTRFALWCARQYSKSRVLPRRP